MNKIKIGFILGAFLFFAQTYAQLGDNKFPSYFGIQVKTYFHPLLLQIQIQSWKKRVFQPPFIKK
ncbi:MAG: hypothetical protein EBQ66_02910 [Flavobacteriia bacterium]|nr:hypothetical protein [Flavobacteriia bacterium]